MLLMGKELAKANRLILTVPTGPTGPYRPLPALPVGLFHPLQHAGLSRRSTVPIGLTNGGPGLY
jgi:hypothetical protein